MGWSVEKVDELLLPMMKRMNTKLRAQPQITQFFPNLPKIHQRKAIESRRVRNAVTRIRNQGGVSVCALIFPRVANSITVLIVKLCYRSCSSYYHFV